MVSTKQLAKSTSYFEQMKWALENYADCTRLGEDSPLAAPYFLGAALHGVMPTTAVRGAALCAEIDKALTSLWGGPLPLDAKAMVAAVTEETETQGRGGRYDCLILELNYLKRCYKPAPKSQAEIYNDILHISRPTHDRHLHDAVQRLGALLLQRVRPAIRPEKPTLHHDLIGRAQLQSQIMADLQAGKSVSLTGPGGVGKTSVATAITEQWHSPAVFWFTLRPTFNDQLDSLLFALGHFLHEQGASTLWHQLVADGGRLKDVNLALGLARSDLAALTHQPLLCFDELDFLRPLLLDAPNPKHVQLLEFIDSLRRHTPLLLIGQRAFWESDALYVVEALTPTQLATLLENLTIPATREDIARLHVYTGGNPRLVELCGALYLVDPGQSLTVVLDQLPQSPALLPLWHRLERRLPATERRLLQALAVFRTPAPVDAWGEAASAEALQQLIQRRLVQHDGQDGVILLPALREVIYTELSVENREHYHQLAATIRIARGEYTSAAYHLWQADQPEAAVAIWYPQRQEEINRGQASTALAIFEQISQRRLGGKQGKELLLLRSELYQLIGQPEKVIATMEAQSWVTSDHLGVDTLTIDAHILWGNALSQRGRIDAALDKYREGLALQLKLMNQATQLYTLRSHTYLHQRDMQQVRQEINLARFQVENLQGAFYDFSGNYERAYSHYHLALAVAQEMNDASAMAAIQHNLALLVGRQQGLTAAAGYYEQAMNHYQQSGNLYRLEMVRSNLANTQIQSRQFAAAVDSAGRALRFFQSTGDTVRIAQNASNLAEALVELDQLTEAESYAHLVLEQEEPHSHPYALYSLGTMRRKQNRLNEAELYYGQARKVAELNEDRYLLAYSWEALAQIYQELGKAPAAQQAIEQAEQGFQQLGIAEKISQIALLKQQIDASAPLLDAQSAPSPC